jgi:hypothetical protein
MSKKDQSGTLIAGYANDAAPPARTDQVALIAWLRNPTNLWFDNPSYKAGVALEWTHVAQEVANVLDIPIDSVWNCAYTTCWDAAPPNEDFRLPRMKMHEYDTRITSAWTNILILHEDVNMREYLRPWVTAACAAMLRRLISRFKNHINKYTAQVSAARDNGIDVAFTHQEVYEKLGVIGDLTRLTAVPNEAAASTTAPPPDAVTAPPPDADAASSSAVVAAPSPAAVVAAPSPAAVVAAPSPVAVDAAPSPVVVAASTRTFSRVHSRSTSRAGSPTPLNTPRRSLRGLASTPTTTTRRPTAISQVDVTTVETAAATRSKRGRAESPNVDSNQQAKRRRRVSPARDRPVYSMDHHYIRLIDERDQALFQVSLGSLEKPNDTPYWAQIHFNTNDVDVGKLLGRQIDGTKFTLKDVLEKGFELVTLDGKVLPSTPMESKLLDWIWENVSQNLSGGVGHVLRLRKKVPT